jgi:general secretion pathway protein C
MKFDQLLKRHFWAVILSMVSITAFFHAQAITQIVGSRLAPDEAQLAAIPSGPHRLAPASSGPTRDLSALAILARNPFDSITGPLNEAPLGDLGLASAGAAAIDLSDPMNAPQCEGVKVIVIAASTDPDLSFAAFTPTAPGAEQKSVLRRRGGDVAGKTVKFIGWDRVWLLNGATLCQLDMFRPPPPPGAPPPAAPGDKDKGGGSDLAKDIAKGIQKIGPTEFNIERSVVDKILENQAELMKTARIVPEKEGDKMTGIRLFGVKPDTLLGVLGMENGDRLQTINGFDMTSPEKALEAYARLRTADHLTVQVNRKGANTNLDYNIQ